MPSEMPLRELLTLLGPMFSISISEFCIQNTPYTLELNLACPPVGK